VSMQEYARG